MKFLITGDMHGHIDERFDQLISHYEPSKTAIIVLGDVGANYYLSKKDKRFKEQLNNFGYTFYCVHGNHEERPEKIKGMKTVYDENVKGMVYYEEEYPNIKYFQIWGEYEIDGYKTLVMGGAYSVDKEYRLINHWQWFPTEQMTAKEKYDCFNAVERQTFDLVLSHTCPYSWQPFDLFLPFIDQSKVDSGTEYFFENILQNIKFKKWCYGHFHDDRWQNNRARMFYKDCVKLKSIMDK